VRLIISLYVTIAESWQTRKKSGGWRGQCNFV